MKVAISATGPSLDDEVDPRFGRCQYFIVVDPDTMEFEALENTKGAASGGAGIASAQAVASTGAQVVLTGNCGPNAYQTLNAAGIGVATGVSGNLRNAIEEFKAGRFQVTSGPTVDAHAGTGGGVGTRSHVGRGMGAGRGMGIGMGMGSSSLGQELEVLKDQFNTMERQLSEIMHRLDELGKKDR